jgi:hypothetical protein
VSHRQLHHQDRLADTLDATCDDQSAPRDVSLINIVASSALINQHGAHPAPPAPAPWPPAPPRDAAAYRLPSDEYKRRRQGCAGVKVTEKDFGRDRRSLYQPLRRK